MIFTLVSPHDRGDGASLNHSLDGTSSVDAIQHVLGSIKAGLHHLGLRLGPFGFDVDHCRCVNNRVTAGEGGVISRGFQQVASMESQPLSSARQSLQVAHFGFVRRIPHASTHAESGIEQRFDDVTGYEPVGSGDGHCCSCGDCWHFSSASVPM